MYCYENFSAELPTEVFILAYNRKKLCRNQRIISVSAQLNKIKPYDIVLFIQAFLHQCIRALFPDRL